MSNKLSVDADHRFRSEVSASRAHAYPQSLPSSACAIFGAEGLKH